MIGYKRIGRSLKTALKVKECLVCKIWDQRLSLPNLNDSCNELTFCDIGAEVLFKGKIFLQEILTNTIFVLFYRQPRGYLFFGDLRPGVFPDDQENKVVLYVRTLVHSGRN